MLPIPPEITAKMAKGFTLYTLKALFRGRAEDLVDLARTNLWAGVGLEVSNGRHRSSSVAASVRIYNLVPHHLSIVHDRPRGVAAPHSSLAFMFWGEGLFVFPLMLVYTAISYAVFRGKVRPASVNY